MKTCKKKAAFKVSTDNGHIVLTCGLHFLRLMKAYRPLIRRGHTTVFVQKYREPERAEQ